MEFSARAIIGGIGTAVLCVAFPPITAVALPAYGLACVAGKQRDRRLEDSSDSSESGDYDMNPMVRRSYGNPVRRTGYEDPIYMGPPVDFSNLMSAEAVLARSSPRAAERVLSRQTAASIMETGSSVIASTAAEALRSGRDFSTIGYDAVEKERLFGRFTVRTHEFHGRLTMR